MSRRVVVTGIGLVSSLGIGTKANWDALVSGTSGVGPITKFDASGYAAQIAAEVKGFDPTRYMDRKEAKRSDLYTQFAVAGAVQAMKDAGHAAGTYDPLRTGVIVGSGIGGISTFETQHDVLRDNGANRISAFFVPMFIGDIAAGVVSMHFGAKGPNFATQSACATSAHAIGVAFRAVQYGDADVMMAGGAEAHAASRPAKKMEMRWRFMKVPLFVK